YWALARLPRPFVDPRRPFQGEILMNAAVFPDLEELKKGPLPLDQAQKYMDEFVGHWRQLGISNLTRPELTLEALSVYPKAKAALIRGGRTPAEVEAMPVPQVLLLHSAEEFFRMRDDIFKWALLPFPEAYEGMMKATERLQAQKERG